MQTVFNVTKIECDYSNKKITVITNFTVDKTTVNKKAIKIVEAVSGTIPFYKLTVESKNIIITFKESPVLESMYQINITDIKDVLGRELVHPLTKELQFKADTQLKAKIVCPKNNEVVFREHGLVKFSIQQINADGSITTVPRPELHDDLMFTNNELQNEAIEEVSDIKYHFEFASDIAFFDIVKDYLSTDFTDGLIALEYGQYYMRAKIIENDMPGDWSEIITFSIMPDADNLCDDELKSSEKEFLEDVLAPVEFFLEDDEQLNIVSRNSNGVTDSEFYIEFNIDLDPESIPDQIIAYRRNL